MSGATGRLPGEESVVGSSMRKHSGYTCIHEYSYLGRKSIDTTQANVSSSVRYQFTESPPFSKSIEKLAHTELLHAFLLATLPSQHIISSQDLYPAYLPPTTRLASSTAALPTLFTIPLSSTSRHLTHLSSPSVSGTLNVSTPPLITLPTSLGPKFLPIFPFLLSSSSNPSKCFATPIKPSTSAVGEAVEPGFGVAAGAVFVGRERWAKEDLNLGRRCADSTSL